jgi:outer membrane protein assembly factor BamB
MIETAHPADALAVGGDALWVAYTESNNGEIARIDPATNTIVATIAAGRVAGPILYADGSLWVFAAQNGEPVLKRLDPSTGAVIAIVPLPGDGQGLVIAKDLVWVATTDLDFVREEPREDRRNALLAIDPANNEIVAATPLDVNPTGLAAGNDALWILSGPAGRILHFDPTP